MALQDTGKEVCGAPLQIGLYSSCMSGIGERLRRRREALKLSQPQLAKKIGGISYQAIQAIEKGGATKHLNAIARALEVAPDWLETGEGPMELRPSDQPAPGSLAVAPVTDLNIQALPKDLPVMGNASCGEDGLFELNGEILDYVRRPPRLIKVKGAYALWVQGESMVPWREHGGLVVVHPHQPVRANDYVVVQLKPQTEHDENRKAYIKRLVKRTHTGWVLRQFNPAKDFTVPESRVLVVHRILDWDEAMGF